VKKLDLLTCCHYLDYQLRKIRQRTISGLFQFTCGNIRPISSYFKTKDYANKLREQKVEEKGKKRFRRVEGT
jgi:hypothetical protein